MIYLSIIHSRSQSALVVGARGTVQPTFFSIAVCQQLLVRDGRLGLVHSLTLSIQHFLLTATARVAMQAVFCQAAVSGSMSEPGTFPPLRGCQQGFLGTMQPNSATVTSFIHFDKWLCSQMTLIYDLPKAGSCTGHVKTSKTLNWSNDL